MIVLYKCSALCAINGIGFYLAATFQYPDNSLFPDCSPASIETFLCVLVPFLAADASLVGFNISRSSLIDGYTEFFTLLKYSQKILHQFSQRKELELLSGCYTNIQKF